MAQLPLLFLILQLLSFQLIPTSPHVDKNRQTPPIFNEMERSGLQKFWSNPGRYAVSLPSDSGTRGVWQVRLTPEGSVWLMKYQAVVGAAGSPPTQSSTAIAPADRTIWKTWVQARVARDRSAAQQAADAANRAIRAGGSNPGRPTALNSDRNSNATGPHVIDAAGDTPTPLLTDPGPIPASLLAAAGNPPPFAAVVTPMQHTVCLDETEKFTYVDNVDVPQAYAYYRFPQGVAVFRSPEDDRELTSVFAASGMSESEQRVARAVSKLEGSFESINTYDTGYVSVGFLQFITLDDGRHSLVDVLKTEKLRAPNDFDRDFHRFGIDISDDGVIVVVDPNTLAELSGPDAVRKLVDDKRLIAVFQRAGRHSTPFRVAQVAVARANYWPADDAIIVNLGAGTIVGKVSDIVHSEAGLATLFDRKVNRGSCAPISDVVGRIMQQHGLSKLSDVVRFERELIASLRYRGDFLNDTSLKQPR